MATEITSHYSLKKAKLEYSTGLMKKKMRSLFTMLLYFRRYSKYYNTPITDFQ